MIQDEGKRGANIEVKFVKPDANTATTSETATAAAALAANTGVRFVKPDVNTVETRDAEQTTVITTEETVITVTAETVITGIVRDIIVRQPVITITTVVATFADINLAKI